MDRKFVVDNPFTRGLEHDTPTGGWLLICEHCGMKSVHLVEEAE